MKIDRALKIRDRAKVWLSDVFSWSEFYGASHEEMLSRRTKVLADCKGAPRWVHAYLSGWWAAKLDALYRNELEWVHFAPDGVIYSAHKNTAHRNVDEIYKANRGSEIQHWQSAHVWRARECNPSRQGRVFYPSNKES